MNEYGLSQRPILKKKYLLFPQNTLDNVYIRFKCAENHIVGANSTFFTLLSPSVDYIKAVFI